MSVGAADWAVLCVTATFKGTERNAEICSNVIFWLAVNATSGCCHFPALYSRSVSLSVLHPWRNSDIHFAWCQPKLNWLFMGEKMQRRGGVESVWCSIFSHDVLMRSWSSLVKYNTCVPALSNRKKSKQEQVCIIGWHSSVGRCSQLSTFTQVLFLIWGILLSILCYFTLTPQQFR